MPVGRGSSSVCFWPDILACGAFTAKSRPTDPGLANALVVNAANNPIASRPHTKPIEQVQLGNRVLGENPELTDADRKFLEPEPAASAETDPAAPRLTAVGREDVELLRPLEWLDEQKAKVGGTVDITVPECGIRRACGGSSDWTLSAGQVREGARCHWDIQAQHVASGDVNVEGLEKHMAARPISPYPSEDRQKFITDALRPGERVRTLKGLATVVTVGPGDRRRGGVQN